MTADPLTEMGPPRLPSWLTPPPEGYFAEDLDRLPDLPRHTQLIDGGLVFVSPQAKFHMRVISFLERTLSRQAPESLEVCREMTVTLGPRQRPEPDLLVASADADTGLDQTTFQPQDVVLVIEVMSLDSVIRDRERKPQLYAQAGIPHMWRIENVDDRAVAYIYELDPALKTYALSGIHHDRLKLSVPFEIDIDLTAAVRRKAEADQND
ncbi:Uma2 family endonuclease [Nocardia pseudobrasiliensis]|uniref:Uma2 family endonuclease n=1 Tax=Nocardia pseudobrasiliensis TaxID=45979 RepID=A0A370ID97_9NOCA|nr:Uma2 family endonuclease [Nocardia pseudobrasiliensis]RDI68693.1 Uma2 family endonuclease [Nocardia pseudobrasiliensis]